MELDNYQKREFMEVDNGDKREFLELENGDKRKSIKSESGGSTVCGISCLQLNGDKAGSMTLDKDVSVHVIRLW